MAIITIKQMEFPEWDINLPKPEFPDPYANTNFVGYDDGTDKKLYIWNSVTEVWDEATVAEQIQNVPNYNTKPTNYFKSTSTAAATLEDYRFLNHYLRKIEADGILFYEGVHFNKAKDSTDVVMISPNTLLPNFSYDTTIE